MEPLVSPGWQNWQGTQRGPHRADTGQALWTLSLSHGWGVRVQLCGVGGRRDFLLFLVFFPPFSYFSCELLNWFLLNP